MAERSLTVQMHLAGRWHDAADLTLEQHGEWAQVTYRVDHVFPGRRSGRGSGRSR